MSFYSRYELTDLLRDESIKTFAARQLATGKQVAVHIFVAGRTPENERVLQSLAALSPERRREVLEAGEHEGTPFVVTEAWSHPRGFADWVESPVPASAEAPDRFAKAGTWRVPTAVFNRKGESLAPQAPGPEAAAGDFTRMFQTPQAAPRPAQPGSVTGMFGSAPPIPEPQPVPPAPQPEPQEPQPPTPPVTAGAPGEFTRMFQTPAAAPQPQAPASPPGAPGEFTRMFQTPAPPPPARVSPSSGTPGEFTRMFQAPSPPAHEPIPPAAAAPPSAPPRPSGPGEFTRFFETPVEKPGPVHHPAFKDPFQTPPPAAPGPSAPGAYTQMFGVPAVQAPAPFPPATAYAVPPPAQAAPQGPGEYTRMFASPQPPAPAPAAQPPSQPAAPAQPVRTGPSALPLIIVFGVLFVLAVALVLFFALKK